jgi:hypothetical protein
VELPKDAVTRDFFEPKGSALRGGQCLANGTEGPLW